MKEKNIKELKEKFKYNEKIKLYVDDIIDTLEYLYDRFKNIAISVEEDYDGLALMLDTNYYHVARIISFNELPKLKDDAFKNCLFQDIFYELAQIFLLKKGVKL